MGPWPPALLSGPRPSALMLCEGYNIFANSRQVAWFTFLLFGIVAFVDNQKIKITLIKKTIHRNILKDVIDITYSAAYFQTYQRLREVTPTKICLFLTSNLSQEVVFNVTPVSDFCNIIDAVNAGYRE